MFAVFGSGVAAAIARGMLPGGYSVTAFFVTALLSSVVMNLAFGPTLMGLHRILDTCIDLADGRFANLARLQLCTVVGRIDWYGFVSFVVLRTIPLFWIPAHVMTFLLPSEYQVLMTTLLAIALGAVLTFAKNRSPLLRRVK
jgi:hypothetical protein